MTDSSEDEVQKTRFQRPTFSMGNLLMVVALIGICLGWWVDHNRRGVQEYDIQGPVSIFYTIRTSPNSTAGGRFQGALGIDFRGSNIVVYTGDDGVVMPSSSMIDFSWKSDVSPTVLLDSWSTNNGN
ncbi:hypothetical protein N9B60_06955 [Mariniblastus sp.]|nr:hypothetical protein [Mariniblastus sp.]